MSKSSSKVRKRYVLQYRKKQNIWEEIRCDYNGKWVSYFGGYEGNTTKPNEKTMEKVKALKNDFATGNYRVLERTIVWIDNK